MPAEQGYPTILPSRSPHHDVKKLPGLIYVNIFGPI